MIKLQNNNSLKNQCSLHRLDNFYVFHLFQPFSQIDAIEAYFHLGKGKSKTELKFKVKEEILLHQVILKILTSEKFHGENLIRIWKNLQLCICFYNADSRFAF